jgi:hypothetical protein
MKLTPRGRRKLPSKHALRKYSTERKKRNPFFREVEKRSRDEPNTAKVGILNGHLGFNIFEMPLRSSEIRLDVRGTK